MSENIEQRPQAASIEGHPLSAGGRGRRGRPNIVPLGIVGIVATVALAGFAIHSNVGISFGAMRLDKLEDVVQVGKNAEVIRQDASERFVVLVPRSEGEGGGLSTCAEPPPDVTQNLAQSLNSSLTALAKTSDKLEGSVQQKISADLKSASESLFQRSQGIQLLRDTMFRLCEANQNRALSSGDYRYLIQNLITTANFIIPFEQCTAIARANQQTAMDKIEPVVQACLNSAAKFSLTTQQQQRELSAPEMMASSSKPSNNSLVTKVGR